MLRVQLVRDPVLTSSARVVRASLKKAVETDSKGVITYDQRIWEAERSAGEGNLLPHKRENSSVIDLILGIGEYTLLNLLYASEGSYLAQLRDYLSRIEDMPYILVWTRGKPIFLYSAIQIAYSKQTQAMEKELRSM